MSLPTHRVFLLSSTKLTLQSLALSYSKQLAGNVMQALEDRTEKSRREMDLHDTIDTVRVLNARNQNIDIDKVIGPSRLTISTVPFIMFSFFSHAITLRHRLLPHGVRTILLQSSSAAGCSHALSSRFSRIFRVMVRPGRRLRLCSFQTFALFAPLYCRNASLSFQQTSTIRPLFLAHSSVALLPTTTSST